MLRDLQGPPMIMVVEDDADSRLMMKTLLTMKGYCVVEAGDGWEALEVAERERPGMVIMDLQLPRLHGFDVARHLRQHTELGQIPIIIISGYDSLQHKPLALAAGCNEYLNKPIDFDLLENTLSRLLPLVSS
ncbi:MAG TPA: response regulator [Pyrinomonadaceae bacterium]|jgi:chemosensory pili system protein ChpA (sensor histidine kinase/response regulator)